ncbi:hypothetical protein D9757_012979 [Collybiopsis confluens]|uniref:Wax synthase domain-containing protein n=1 Tax=Collybiopsis confluens TaxID=2823264 RepID=A0A8H5GID7_9AGAR|nr:hypothetical protein D9757_012979 [Collybiopsis confluens]
MSPTTEGPSSGLVPTPGFAVPVMYPIFIFGLTFTSRITRSVFFVALLSIAIFVVFYSTTGHPSTNYIYATSLWSLIFQSLDYLVIVDPYTEFSLVDQPPSSSPSALPFLSRLKWSTKLVLSPRGIGFKHEPKSVLPPHPSPQSRLRFIFLHQLPSLVPYLLLADIGNLLLRSHPSFLPNGPSLSSVGPIMRYINVFIFALGSYCTLQLNYIISSIIFTSLHFYSPQDFPSLMGSWGDAYTVRRFWGRTWHQMMRRWLSSAGTFVVQRTLRIQKGTNLSAYSKLFIAFFISGLIHQMGDYALRHRVPVFDSFWEGGSIKFFVLQTGAIMLEDGVIALGKNAFGIRGNSRAIRVLGYVWTASWFAYCLPIWTDPYFHDGMATGELVSLIGGVWKGDWKGTNLRFTLPLDY